MLQGRDLMNSKKLKACLLITVILVLNIMSIIPVRAVGAAPLLAVGSRHTVVIRSDDIPWAWGFNGMSQLGLPGSDNYLSPTEVAGYKDIKALSGGGDNTIAINNDNKVLMSGHNVYGQLGIGNDDGTTGVVQVQNLVDVVAVALGDNHSIAVKSDGTVWTWGGNGDGQLGDGTTTNRHLPVQVTGLTGITDVAGGFNFTLALKDDGTVWAWGSNSQGQLGNGTKNDESTPIQVPGLSNVISLSAGRYHSIALKSDGTVWACGYNGEGQLGDGTTDERTTPVQMLGLSNISSISAGGFHSVALKNDGTVWTCGRNNYGQLGDGTYDYKSTPVQLTGLSNITKVESGYEFTVAVDNKGAVYAWGRNDENQLSGNTPSRRSTPSVVPGFSPILSQNVTAVSYNTIEITGTIINDGGESIIERGLVLSTDSNPTIDDGSDIKVLSTDTTDVFVASYSNLSPDTTYHVRAFASNSSKTTYGPDYEFTTPSLTGTAPGITEENLNGYVVSLEVRRDTFVSNLDALKFSLENAPAGTSVSSVSRVDDTHGNVTLAYDGTDFDTDINNLKILIAGDQMASGQVIGSNDLSITARIETAPVVETSPALVIRSTSAHLGGNITNNGGEEIAERGVVYALTSHPTIGGSLVSQEKATGSDNPFYVVGTNLPPASTIYYRSYAINSVGTTYGSNTSFTTTSTTLTGSTLEEIIEPNLNGQVIVLELSGDTFKSSLDQSKFTLNNEPNGVTLANISRIDDTHVNVTLAFDGTDFDHTVTDFYITVSSDQVTSGVEIYSENMTITGVQKSLKSFEAVVLNQSGNLQSNNLQYPTSSDVINALPTSIEVTLDDNSQINMPISWTDTDNYTGKTSGYFTFISAWGSFPHDVDNDDNVTAPTCEVYVDSGIESTTEEQEQELTPTEKASDKIKSSQPNDHGVIELSIKADTTSSGKTTFKLPSNFIKSEVPIKLTVERSDLEVTLNSNMFSDRKYMDLNIESVKKEDLGLSEDELNKIGDLPIYNIYFKELGKKVDWESDEDIVVSIKMKEAKNEHNFVAVYYDGNGNMQILKSSYCKDGLLFFSTKHLSDYGVMYVEPTFKDIEYHWAKESIEALAVRGVIAGVSDDAFNPNHTITRADLIVLIVNYFGFNDNEAEYLKSFDDVCSTKYYSEAINTARKIDLVKGCGGNMFMPDNPVSRQDMMVILNKAIEISEGHKLADNDISCTLSDDVSDYAKECVRLLIGNEIVKPHVMGIDPKMNATRAEVADALYQILISGVK